MKKNKISHLLIVLWLLLSCPTSCLAKPVPQVPSKETSYHIHYLLPTSETKDFYDVYEEGGDYPFFTALLDNTFIKQDLCLYNQVLKYAPELSPTLNVIFKPQSGCYGKIGFYLKHKDGSYEFMNESYIILLFLKGSVNISKLLLEIMKQIQHYLLTMFLLFLNYLQKAAL